MAILKYLYFFFFELLNIKSLINKLRIYIFELKISEKL